jgi:hypothetical protein
MRNQRGFGLVKAIVTILIIVAVTIVGVELGRLGFAYYSLKDEMRGVAKYKSMETEDLMKKLILDRANSLGIDVWEQDIEIDVYPGEKTVIWVYGQKDLVFPFYRRRFEFEIVVEEPLK